MGVSSIFNLGKTFHDQTTGKILLISLLFLFLVIALVISIHIYAKWCLLRSPEPDSIHSSTSLPSAATTVVIRRYRRDAVARRGLDRRVLKAIPVLVLEGEKGSECAVCLCEVAEGEKYRVLPKCGHGFHVDCIDMWFASHTTCPLCRDTVSVPGLSLVKKQRSEVNLDAILETARAENAAMFPTNVLFWGNQMQVSTHTLTPTEEDNTRATSSGTVAIDMPRQAVNEEEEQSGAVTTRLRSLKRMLSRDRKINPCSPSNDATQL